MTDTETASWAIACAVVAVGVLLLYLLGRASEAAPLQPPGPGAAPPDTRDMSAAADAADAVALAGDLADDDCDPWGGL